MFALGITMSGFEQEIRSGHPAVVRFVLMIRQSSAVGGAAAAFVCGMNMLRGTVVVE